MKIYSAFGATIYLSKNCSFAYPPNELDANLFGNTSLHWMVFPAKHYSLLNYLITWHYFFQNFREKIVFEI